MDEDLRNRFRRDYSGSRKPVALPVRPARTTPVPKPVAAKPHQTARPPQLPTAAPVEAKVVEQPEPKPAKPTRPSKQKSPKRKKRLIVSLVIVMLLTLVGAAVYFGITVVKPKHDQSKKNTATASANTTFPGISFPIYYPSNLPPGYTYNNDAKVIQNNVLFYSITDPNGTKFFVTLQKLPPAFNFAAFNDKFLKPDQYTTNVGSVIAGQVGSSYIGSIQTSNNVWIIINSETKNTLPQLEAITRSFQEAK